MEVKHIQPGQILGSSGLLPFVVPSLITPSLLIGLLIAISGYDRFIQFFNSLTHHQASLLLILFCTSIVWNAYYFKTRIYFAELYPETLFRNEVAGRFSLLVTYFAHFKNYSFRRYGFQISDLWQHMVLTIPADSRRELSKTQTAFATTTAFYLALRDANYYCLSFVFSYLLLSSLSEWSSNWWHILLCLLVFGIFVFSIWMHLIFFSGRYVWILASLQILVNPSPIFHFFSSAIFSAYFISVYYFESFALKELLNPGSLGRFSLQLIEVGILLAFCLLTVSLLFFSYSAMTATGIRYGRVVQAITDLYSENLIRSFNSNEKESKSFWKEQTQFLHKGTRLWYPEDPQSSKGALPRKKRKLPSYTSKVKKEESARFDELMSIKSSRSLSIQEKAELYSLGSKILKDAISATLAVFLRTIENLRSILEPFKRPPEDWK